MPSQSLTLEQIRRELPGIEWHNYRTLEIKDIQQDSRKVTAGSLFVALDGTKARGKDYLQDAVAKGAAAVVADEYCELPSGQAIPFGIAQDPRDAIAALAALFWGYPARKLCFVGITGTNGKTTTAFLVRSIFEAAGYRVALLGTVGYFYGDHCFEAPNTTPDVLTLQQHFAHIVAEGISHVVMEVSSHSLTQKRVAQIPFQAAIFTNLGRDHLDYHETIENYRDAKTLLFRGLTNQAQAILNGDDPQSPYFRKVCPAHCHLFGLESGHEVTARDIRYEHLDSVFELITNAATTRVKLQLPGFYNIYNALAATTAASSLGIPLDIIRTGLEKLTGVPGRMEKIEAGQPFGVIVDYAHTPNAMEAALTTLAKIKRHRLLVVFGCGGDRDQGKRPQMGAVAARCADLTWVTSDNPRSEAPEKIAEQVVAGFTGQPYHLALDREEAICQALGAARDGDIVAIVGKGHETYQLIGKQVLPFDDRQVARDCLKRLGF